MTDIDVTTVAAWKGGVGKTTLAFELAYQLNAVLVDLDWDRGGASRAWGYRHETRRRAMLLDSLENGKPPTPLRGGDRKPDLVPSHPDLAVSQPDPETLADRLSDWARHWGRPVVVDTHPGGGDATFGAMAVSRVVAVPTVFGTKELDALEGMLEEVPDYPLMLVPNLVRAPNTRDRARLRKLATDADVPVAPPVPWCAWIPTRQIRIAITSEPVAKRAEEYTAQIQEVAQAIRQYS
ncbi:ParA family protein [Actinomadura sp. 6N118]|uniref:ParA family protein n=1 Tax=Actinomadura sp. 6N118 TaxID=3375151 RepID=UPI0037986AA7